jgi:hypothetical protein
MHEINTGLVGLVGALYAGYGAYVFQKIQDAKNEKRSIEEKVRNLCESISYFELSDDAKSTLTMPDFWGRVIKSKSLDRGKMFVSYWKSGKGIYGFNYAHGRTTRQDNSVEIVTIFNDAMFSLKFALDTVNRKEIDKASLNDFKTMISDLNNFANKPPNTAIDLGNIADEAINNEKWNIGSTYRHTRWSEKAQIFMSALNLCNFEFLPLLTKAVYEIEDYSKTYNFKKTTLAAIGIVSWILFFGIFLPPILLTLQADFTPIFPHWLQSKVISLYFYGKYVLLLFNLMPYAVVLVLIWRKILDFKEH